ncbi:hypothetical protein [Streptomyces sp. Ac-502]|uniref:hypothetical protein n=1 Tax=Streptomyces sp. Ac-502 TaxID=3342801 RepID=UPI0038628C20
MTPPAPDDPEHGQENALHRDDGRTLFSRADLQEGYHLSESTLQNLWTDRENNDHPDAEIIDGVMHWDDAEWAPWYRKLQRQRATVAEQSAGPFR